jgi:hypothetical protein
LPAYKKDLQNEAGDWRGWKNPVRNGPEGDKRMPDYFEPNQAALVVQLNDHAVRMATHGAGLGSLMGLSQKGAAP